jgi:hypothetical protein
MIRPQNTWRPTLPARGVRLTALLALVLFVVFSVSTAAVVSPTAKFGLYRGARNPAGVFEFQQWLGQPVRYAADFITADSWRTIEKPVGLKRWSYPNSKSHPFRIVYGVPIIPYTGGSLADGASGAYNIHFRRLARALRTAGQGDATLRLGWEFSGGWYPWSVRTDDDARVFARYWRQIVKTMRAVSPKLQFDWNPAHGWRPFNIDLAYPGNAYVDTIGMDVYDQGWQSNYTDAVARWADTVNGEGGLAWQRDFASAKGKPISFPEWGLAWREDGHGGGDNPYFVEQMHDWIVSNNVAYHVYFDFDAPDGAHALLTGRFPNAAEALHAVFNGQPAPTPAPAEAPP